MTRLASQHGAINLAQGFPNFAAPQELKEAAVAAINADVNQYAVTWGTERLRRAVASAYERWYDMRVDPDSQITVACGATEAMATVVLALIDPGEEVIVFEPFYENYGPDVILCGGKPIYARMPLDGSPIDLEQLGDLFNDNTRAIIINSPNNPTGRVFSRPELERIAELCRRYDVVAITDEIYEHIIYEGEHIPMATLEGMAERTVTVSGASKTFSVTGWRIGTIVSPPELTGAIRKVHDFLTVGAPAPLQEGVAAGLELLDEGYYRNLESSYRERRDRLCAGLSEAGFRFAPPAGAYYVMADFSQVSDRGDVEFAEWLTAEVGVAGVPGSSFYSGAPGTSRMIRFAFCKTLDILDQAIERLSRLT